MDSGLDSLFTKASGLDVRNGSVFAAALPPSSSPPPPPLVVVVAVVAPAAALNSFNRSLKTATVPLASSPLSSQHFTNSAFFIELNRVTGPAPLDDDDAGAAAFPSPPNAARSMSSHSFALKNIGAVKIGGSTFNTFSVGRFFTRERKNSNAKNPAKLRKADTRKDTHTHREREREKERERFRQRFVAPKNGPPPRANGGVFRRAESQRNDFFVIGSQRKPTIPRRKTLYYYH